MIIHMDVTPVCDNIFRSMFGEVMTPCCEVGYANGFTCHIQMNFFGVMYSEFVGIIVIPSE
jgi:hypothetical protein